MFHIFFTKFLNILSYVGYGIFTTLAPAQSVFQNSQRTKLLMKLQMVERLRQDVDNLSGTPAQHGRVKNKLTEPFRPTNKPRKQQCKHYKLGQTPF